MKKAEAEIMEAYNSGVNYYDTAYIYPGSETAIGEIFERNNIRDKIYIADKLPHYLIKSREGAEKIFNEMLKRLRTDHIDFFLMHMLTDMKSWQKMLDLGIGDWLKEKKASGKIRRIGFSYHGKTESFCELIDAFDWEFVMIQYNYLDEGSQAGRRGVEYAAAKGLPVMVMEPLRGGKLVNLLPESAKKLIAEYTPAELSFRWLWNQPEITTVLSGMNSVEMIRENCRVASEAEAGAFTEAEFELIEKVKAEINKSMKVGCTGCGYCMPCPKGVDIPGTFNAYNSYYSLSRSSAKKSYIQCTLFRHEPSSASLCVGCGKCEQHCPQGIEIRRQLKSAVKVLETPVYAAAKHGIRLLRLW